MSNGIYSAVSGAVAQTTVLDVVANNLANATTVGYKAGRINFAEVLAKATARNEPGCPSFVTPAEVRMDLRPGMMKPTGNPLDVALEGKGYLTLRDGNQTVYSRGGSLEIRTDGFLADQQGRQVLDRLDRPMQPGLEAGPITIDPEGVVRAGDEEVGQLKVVEFQNPRALQRLGSSLVAAPPAAGAQLATDTRVLQGQLEAANVNAVSEISAMIVASRAYETLHKVISSFRDIDSRSLELGREA